VVNLSDSAGGVSGFLLRPADSKILNNRENLTTISPDSAHKRGVQTVA
jgi:hypothetical protein